MPLVPAWAPNLHPLAVHFPIALLFAAVAVDLASLVMHDRKPVRDAATWLYIAGAATAVPAYFTGYAAARAMELSTELATLVDAHGNWAFAATWSFAFFASLRLAMSYILRPGRALRIGAFAVALLGLGALVQTTLHGTRLVFEQGLGVRAVAIAAAAETGNQAAPAGDGTAATGNGTAEAADGTAERDGQAPARRAGEAPAAQAEREDPE